MKIMNVMSPVQKFLNQQYRCPTGPVGRFIGAQMVRQHEPEVQWTLSLLELTPTDQVLEIGCGAGRALELAVPRVSAGHVSGIDYSSTMIEVSRCRNAQAIAAGHLEVFQADVAHLPFMPSQFDTIWSIHTLYFWPDRTQALAELARVLKPGGLLVLTLSPGKVGDSKKSGVLAMVEEHVLPPLRQLGFTASVEQGPHSRQFQTTAIIGRKEGR
jgi:ubiquinone/menaquinone biosynthesis C-methylase UbiE